MRSRLMAVLACAFTVLFLTAAPQAGHARANPLADAFAEAAAAHDVPRDLLVALAYAGPASTTTTASPAPIAAITSSCTGTIQFSVPSPSKRAAESGRL